MARAKSKTVSLSLTKSHKTIQPKENKMKIKSIEMDADPQVFNPEGVPYIKISFEINGADFQWCEWTDGDVLEVTDSMESAGGNDWMWGELENAGEEKDVILEHLRFIAKSFLANSTLNQIQRCEEHFKNLPLGMKSDTYRLEPDPRVTEEVDAERLDRESEREEFKRALRVRQAMPTNDSCYEVDAERLEEEVA